MPNLTVADVGTFEVQAGKRLVLALVEDAAIDQMHACGGNCKCTTCRVEFVDGEPAQMTVAEKEKLAEKELTGVRLSCQCLVESDMTVQIISRLEGTGRPDAGPPPGVDDSAGTGVDNQRLIAVQELRCCLRHLRRAGQILPKPGPAFSWAQARRILSRLQPPRPPGCISSPRSPLREKRF